MVKFKALQSAIVTNIAKDVGQSVGQSVGQKLKPVERQNKILEIINQNEKTTALELSRMFFVSTRTIERDLAKLTEDGNIEYVGSAKGGEWKVRGE